MKNSYVLSLALSLCLSLSSLAEVPAQLAGKWVAGSTSATTYWDAQGTYVGNGSGSGQLYNFHPDGTFSYHMVMEVRTYGMTSTVRTNYSGRVNFANGQFTLEPTSGHYHSEMGSSVTDRAMTADELAKAGETFPYRLEPGADGQTHLIIPFEDGSSHDFSRLEP